MTKKIISITALILFVWFEMRCSLKSPKMVSVEEAINKNSKIFEGVKKSGERFKFKKREPGIIIGNEITGKYFVPNKGIDIADINHSESSLIGQPVIVKTNEGRTIQLMNAQKIGNKIYEMLESKIPLSEIDKVWVEEIDSISSTALPTILLTIPIMLIVLFAKWCGERSGGASSL